MPNMVAVDSGPLIALLSKSDKHHATAVAFVERAEAVTLITTLMVVGQVAYMLRRNRTNLEAGVTWIIENVEMDDAGEVDLLKAVDLLRKYRDLPADMADVSLVAMCERRGISAVASIDSDFAVYRLPKGKPFTNVFFDADIT